MDLLDVLKIVGVLVTAFGTQNYLIKRLTAFVKELSGLKGNAVRGVAFIVGAALGGLFLWPWIVLNPGLHISIYTLIGVLFLGIAGLAASGDYDLSNEVKS